MQILKTHKGLVGIGFMPGQLVQVWQGRNEEKIIHHMSLREPGEEGWQLTDKRTLPDWGSELYLVRQDRSMKRLARNDDSSD